jgi:hypothetical protein
MSTTCSYERQAIYCEKTVHTLTLQNDVLVGDT